MGHGTAEEGAGTGAILDFPRLTLNRLRRGAGSVRPTGTLLPRSMQGYFLEWAPDLRLVSAMMLRPGGSQRLLQVGQAQV